jgi:peptide/nickel transport system permease protein
VGRRAVQALAVVALLSIVTFLLMHLLPGGPAHAMLEKDATDVQISDFNRQMGLDQPLWIQYWIWVSNLAHGNLGFSPRLNQPVRDAIGAALPRTVLLMSISTALAVVVSILLGTFQATRRNSIADHVLTATMFTLFATPSFFLALVAILVFAIYLHVLPPVAPQGDTVQEIVTQPLALVLPVLTLAIVPITVLSRYARSSVLDNMNENYVRTARAKGLSERQILWGHVLRNSMLPMATLLGLGLPRILGGALIVEQVFNYPGMGLLAWRATLARDYPILLAVVLIVGVATVLGNLVADLTYAVLDPRIRYVKG